MKKMLLSICALLSLSAIIYCGLHFLFKGTLITICLGYLFYLKKRYQMDSLDEKEEEAPLWRSPWMLVFSESVIFADQVPAHQWRRLLFKHTA